MTEEQMEKAQKLLSRLRSIRGYLSIDQSADDLRVCRYDNGLSRHGREYRHLYSLTHDQGKEVLAMVERWSREELRTIEQKLTDMGVTLPAKEEA